MWRTGVVIASSRIASPNLREVTGSSSGAAGISPALETISTTNSQFLSRQSPEVKRKACNDSGEKSHGTEIR